MRMSGIKGWEKAVPQKRPDNLCATTFTQKAFIPSYEKSYCKPDMTFMVTMEYRRMWFEERAAWQVDAYPKGKKDSNTATFEQRWRQKQKDKAKVKGKECGKDSKTCRKKLNKKYQNCGSKIDSGRGYVGCLSKGNSPCQEKVRPAEGNSPAEISSAQGSLSSQEEAKLADDIQGIKSLTSQRTGNQPKGNSAVQEGLINQGNGYLADESAETSTTQQAEGHELVPKCARCGTFHAQRTKCPTTVLCKDKAFKDRIMRDTC